MHEKQIALGTKWLDGKGQTWEVMRMLANGRYQVATVRTGSTLLKCAGMSSALRSRRREGKC